MEFGQVRRGRRGKERSGMVGFGMAGSGRLGESSKVLVRCGKAWQARQGLDWYA